eukprot:scaffold2103_cov94-Isochrysis_galbana.AAC.2
MVTWPSTTARSPSKSSSRPVVAIHRPTRPSSAASCSSRGPPPYTATGAAAAPPAARRTPRATERVWTASSRVGTSTSTCGPAPGRGGRGWAAMWAKAGSRYASVLPDPAGVAQAEDGRRTVGERRGGRRVVGRRVQERAGRPAPALALEPKGARPPALRRHPELQPAPDSLNVRLDNGAAGVGGADLAHHRRQPHALPPPGRQQLQLGRRLGHGRLLALLLLAPRHGRLVAGVRLGAGCRPPLAALVARRRRPLALPTRLNLQRVPAGPTSRHCGLARARDAILRNSPGRIHDLLGLKQRGQQAAPLLAAA